MPSSLPPAPPATDTIDRIAPTRRPDERTVMRQQWHHLLFLHWAVPAELLRPLIPAELEIDTFDGTAYVGLVPFTMTGVRPIWSPSVPGLSNFHEINVRTYVHYKGAAPGVWFFSLDAANAIAARLARATWALPYFFANMSLDYRAPAGPLLHTGPDARPYIRIGYQTERLWPHPIPAACSLEYGPVGPAAPARVGTLEHFLVERYVLYTADPRRILRARIHHGPYPIQPASITNLSENMIAAAGIGRGDEEPLAHYASGVNVRIYGLHAVRARNSAGAAK